MKQNRTRTSSLRHNRFRYHLFSRILETKIVSENEKRRVESECNLCIANLLINKELRKQQFKEFQRLTIKIKYLAINQFFGPVKEQQRPR